jgi:hypothetical protein
MKMKIAFQQNQILMWSAKGWHHPFRVSQLISTTFLKRNMNLDIQVNNLFLVLPRKKIYCQQWAICMWDTCNKDCQPPSPRKWTHSERSQSQEPSLKWQDKTKNPSLDVPLELSLVSLALTFSGTIPSHTQSLSQRLHDRLQGEEVQIL